MLAHLKTSSGPKVHLKICTENQQANPPQMETNAGGLREGEGGKAGALLLPAAQVSNSMVIVIINTVTTIITTITITITIIYPLILY